GHTDAAASLIRLGGHIGACDSRCAGRDRHERREHAHRRRLPGSVGAKEAEYLALVDAQGDPAHRLYLTTSPRVVLDEVACFHRWRHEREPRVGVSRGAAAIRPGLFTSAPATRSVSSSPQTRPKSWRAR